MIDALICGMAANPAVVRLLGALSGLGLQGSPQGASPDGRMTRKKQSQSSNLSRAEGPTNVCQQEKWSQKPVYTHHGFAHAKVTFLYYPRNYFTELLWDYFTELILYASLPRPA